MEQLGRLHAEEEWFAWAAGFLDGDGCLSSAGGYPMISIAGVDPEPLGRFCRAVGAGHLAGPYARTHPDRWSKSSMYFVQIYKEAIEVVRKLWPHLGLAKRNQARTSHVWDAAELPVLLGVDEDSRRADFSRENLAWAAGFFDAEGCFSSTPRTGVSASITQTDRELLDRFRQAVGIGKIYGPYKTPQPDRYRRKPHYFYKAQGRERVQGLLAMMWTWLGTTKRQQALDRLEWPTTCKRGHPKTPGHTGCGECTRAYWQAQREIRRQPGVGEPSVPYFLEAS